MEFCRALDVLWRFVCEIKYKTDLHSSWHFEVAEQLKVSVVQPVF